METTWDKIWNKDDVCVGEDYYIDGEHWGKVLLGYDPMAKYRYGQYVERYYGYAGSDCYYSNTEYTLSCASSPDYGFVKAAVEAVAQRLYKEHLDSDERLGM